MQPVLQIRVMSKREKLRRLLYIVQWFSFFSFVLLISVFSVTGWMLEVPAGAEASAGTGFIGTYGMRPVLLMLFLAACAFDAVCLIFSRFARTFRYPVKVNSRNVEVQYLLSKMMLTLMQVIGTLYCTFLMIQIYNMQMRLHSAAFAAVSLAAAGLAGTDIGIYLYLAKKNG